MKIGNLITLQPTEGANQTPKAGTIVGETKTLWHVRVSLGLNGKPISFRKSDGLPHKAINRQFPCYRLIGLTYRSVKVGQYFAVASPSCGEVAFIQTNDNTTFTEYHGNQGKGFSRPLPTRLWDAAYYGIDDDTPVRLMTQEQAAQCAKEYRKV